MLFRSPVFVDKRQELDVLLAGNMQDNDLLVVLGAGDVGTLAPTLYQQYGGATEQG